MYLSDQLRRVIEVIWNVMSSVVPLEVPAKWMYGMNRRLVPGGVPTSSVYAVMVALTPQ